MRSIGFIAMLFCMGAAALLIGGLALHERIDFRFNGRAATMQLADSSKKVTIPVGGYDVHLLNVKYSGASGEVVVPQKRLTGEVARKLANGERIPITYLKQDPHRVMYSGEQLENPWGWLALGVALMATFVYALKLKRREAG